MKPCLILLVVIACVFGAPHYFIERTNEDQVKRTEQCELCDDVTEFLGFDGNDLEFSAENVEEVVEDMCGILSDVEMLDNVMKHIGNIAELTSNRTTPNSICEQLCQDENTIEKKNTSLQNTTMPKPTTEEYVRKFFTRALKIWYSRHLESSGNVTINETIVLDKYATCSWLTRDDKNSTEERKDIDDNENDEDFDSHHDSDDDDEDEHDDEEDEHENEEDEHEDKKDEDEYEEEAGEHEDEGYEHHESDEDEGYEHHETDEDEGYDFLGFADFDNKNETETDQGENQKSTPEDDGETFFEDLLTEIFGEDHPKNVNETNYSEVDTSADKSSLPLAEVSEGDKSSMFGVDHDENEDGHLKW